MGSSVSDLSAPPDPVDGYSNQSNNDDHDVDFEIQQKKKIGKKNNDRKKKEKIQKKNKNIIEKGLERGIPVFHLTPSEWIEENRDESIPPEIVQQILYFLTPYDLVNVFLCCKKFHHSGNTGYFWEIYLNHYFKKHDKTKFYNIFPIFPQQPSTTSKKKSKKNPKFQFYENYIRTNEYYKRKYKILEDENEFSELPHLVLSLKAVLVGPSKTGKSSFIRRLRNLSFSEKIESTLGAGYQCFDISGDIPSLSSSSRTRFKLDIWDTSGIERYRAITPMYYNDSPIIFLFFSINNKRTFEELKNQWTPGIRELKGKKDVSVVVFGTKYDLGEIERAVKKEEVVQFCKTEGFVGYVEISNMNKENMFLALGLGLDDYFENHHGMDEEDQDF